MTQKEFNIKLIEKRIREINAKDKMSDIDFKNAKRWLSEWKVLNKGKKN